MIFLINKIIFLTPQINSNRCLIHTGYTISFKDP